VKLYLLRLFGGTNASNTYTSRWLGPEPFTTGSGNVELKTYRYNGVGTELAHVSAESMDLGAAYNGTSMRALPSQAAICVGYRAPAGPVIQRGRSRLYFGPLNLPSFFLQESAAGGTRLNEAYLPVITDAFKSCVAALAASDWTLVVRSGTGAAITSAPATELYVDDVLDVMRSRRTWQLHQHRDTFS
jgi:hypothetical protein